MSISRRLHEEDLYAILTGADVERLRTDAAKRLRGSPTIRLAIEIGSVFTTLVGCDRASDRRWLRRVPNVGDRLAAVNGVLADLRVPADRVELVAWSITSGDWLARPHMLDEGLRLAGMAPKVFVLEHTGILTDIALLDLAAQGVVVRSGPVGSGIVAARLSARYGPMVSVEIGDSETRIVVDPVRGWRDVAPKAIGAGATALEEDGGLVHELGAALWGLIKESGRETAGLTLFAAGAVAPLHAVALAQAAGLRRVLVPPAPAHCGAAGILLTDPLYDTTVPWLAPLKPDEEELEGLEVKRAEVRQGLRTVVETFMGTAPQLEYEECLDIHVPGPNRLIRILLRPEEQPVETLDLGTFFASGGVRAPKRIPDGLPANAREILGALDHAFGEGASKGARTICLTSNCRVPSGLTLETVLGFQGRTPGSFKGPFRIEDPETFTVVPADWNVRIHEDGCAEITPAVT